MGQDEGGAQIIGIWGVDEVYPLLVWESYYPSYGLPEPWPHPLPPSAATTTVAPTVAATTTTRGSRRDLLWWRGLTWNRGAVYATKDVWNVVVELEGRVSSRRSINRALAKVGRGSSCWIMVATVRKLELWRLEMRQSTICWWETRCPTLANWSPKLFNLW